MRYFTPKEALEILAKFNDKIVTVVFTKRTTGELRTLNGILNCSKYVNGKGMSYDPNERNLATIWDLQLGKTLPESSRNKAYRMLNLEAISEIRAGGDIYRP